MSRSILQFTAVVALGLPILACCAVAQSADAPAPPAKLEFRTPSGEPDTSGLIDVASNNILENSYHKDVRPKLVGLMAHRNPKVRERAANSLGYGDVLPEAVEPLGKLLLDPNANVRRAAAQVAASQVKYAEALVGALIASLRDPDSQVVLLAMQGLGKAGPKGAPAVEPLIGILNAETKVLTASGIAARDGRARRFPEVEKEKAPPTEPAIATQDSEMFYGNAAVALGEIGPAAKSAIPSLLKHLVGPSDAERGRQWWSSARDPAAVALGKIGAVEELLKVAASQEASRRGAAIVGLSHVNPTTDPIVAVLIKSSSSTEQGEHLQAIQALGRVRPTNEAIVAALAARLRSTDLSTRANASYAIQHIDPKLESAVQPLLDALKDPEAVVRGNAAQALAEYKSNPQARLAALLLAATDDASSARSPALRAIDKDEKANYPLLLAIVKDDKADVSLVCGALAGLSQSYYNHKEDLQPLALARTQSPQSSPEVKVYAAALLRNVDDKARGLDPIFIAGLKSKKVDVRRISAMLLANMKSAQATGELIAALGDKDHEVQGLIISALSQLKSEDAVPPLCKIAADAKSDFRGTAIMALGEIGKGGKSACRCC